MKAFLTALPMQCQEFSGFVLLLVCLFVCMLFYSFCYTLVVATERTNYFCEAGDVAQLAELLSGMYAALGSMSRTAQSGHSGAHLHSQHMQGEDVRPA